MGFRSRVSALFKSNESSPENNDSHPDGGTDSQTSNPHPEDTTGTTDDHFRSNLNASSRRETEPTRDPGRRIAHTAAKKPDASPYGLKILVPVPQSSDKADRVDIVAIHGLNGHREDTWMDPETGLQWLSDSSCLPKDIPEARVLTFGYNSKTYFSRSESDIPDFASELLWALKAQRTSIEERQRRIVFICHSLGGLVFKQAVIMAHEQRRHYSCILDHICGVVFFGTPHRGSSLAAWDEIGTLIVKASTLGYATNSKLSSSLKVDSKFLRRISESFAARGDDFEVRSFYENLRMKGLNCKVVEKESAILNWPKELPIASNANHSDICKFSSPEDPRYKAASLAVHEAVGQATLGTNLLFDEKNIDFFETLNSDYEDQLHQIDNRIPNTCEWIMSHEIWRQWDSAAGLSLLWITGDAGCGKSVIAKFLIEHFEERNSSSRFHAHVCYFFFKEGLDDQDNASSAVSALIHQILSKQRRLGKRAVDKYKSMPEKDLLHFSTLWSILIAAVQDPNGENTIWVLDGLDECDEKSLEGLIKALAGFMQSQKPAPTIARPACKIILLSRPLNSVERWLRLRSNSSGYNLEKTPGKHSQCFRLSAEEQSASIARDVTLFVKSKISNLGQQSELTAATLRRLEQQLINRADYTFLWVSLVMSIIEEVEVDGISMTQIETILATTKLEDVYEKLLSRRISSLKTRKVLLLILAAVRPLTLDELCVAVEIYQDYHQPEGEEKLERAVTNSKASYLQENANQGKKDLETNKLNFPTASDSPAPMSSSTMVRQAKEGARTRVETISGSGRIRAHVTPMHKPKTNARKRTATVSSQPKMDHSRFTRQTAIRTPKVSDLKELESHMYKPFPNHLRQLCGHFIRIRNRRIFLVHQTAREFLLSRFRGLSHWSISQGTEYSFPSEQDIRRLSGSSSPSPWLHSIRLADANMYMLQVCVHYIDLLCSASPVEKPALEQSGARPTPEKSHENSHRAFFDYAANHWLDHYRPVRQDLKFSYDYLVQPNTPHFNAWVDIEAWNLRRNGRIPNPGTEETFAMREYELQMALQIFNLWDIDSGGYDEEYIHESRYWKKNYTISGDPNKEPVMSEPKAQLPHRVENYRQQHLERMAKEQDPSSPSMGNPTATRSWHH